MSLQWMKRKAKGFEGKKENSKVNDRIQKLICDLKSKRESLAAVQSGFPSSVASFVTNTWMPSVHGGENKKRRWSSMRKKGAFNAKCPSDEVRGSRDSESEICTEPQIVGQVSVNRQSGTAVSEKIFTDPQSSGLFSESEGLVLQQLSATAGSAGQFGDDPRYLGQFGNDSQFVGQFGNDSQFVGQFGNDSQFVGQFGNDPEFVGPCGNDPGAGGEFDNAPRFVGQFGNDQEIVGQRDNDPEAGGEFGNAFSQPVSDPRLVRQSENDPEQSDRDPLSLQLGHEHNCEDQIVVEDVSSVGDISATISSIQGRSARFCPFCKELLVVALVLAVSLSVVLDVKKTALGVTAIVYVLLRVLFGKQDTELKTLFFRATTSSLTILPSICKWADNSVCRALCREFDKSNVFSAAIAPCSDSAKEACEESHGCKLINSDVNKKPRQRRVPVQKTCLEVGVKGLKFSSSLGSSVLIVVVLVGLLAGRFPAFLLALAWYFVLKLVQIIEQGNNIPSFHKGKRQPRYPR